MLIHMVTPPTRKAAFNLALLHGEASDLQGAIAAFEKAVAAIIRRALRQKPPTPLRSNSSAGKVVALLYDWFVVNLAFRRCRSATPTRENHNLTRRPFPLNGPAQSLID